MEENKLSVLKGILGFLPGVLVFFIAYTVTYFIIGLILNLALKLPIIGHILGWLFHARGDSPTMLATILGAFFAFCFTCLVLIKIFKSTRTCGLSCFLVGFFILVIHVVSIIINLFYNDPILTNICQGVAGFCLAKIGYSDLCNKTKLLK